MSDEKIEQIERSRIRPADWTTPTLRTDAATKSDRTKTVLDIKLFYWGVRRIVWNVLKSRLSDQKLTPAGEHPTSVAVTAVASDLEIGSPE